MPADVQQLKEAKAELTKIIEEKRCGPILIRLAWHDAGTYDKYCERLQNIGAENWPKCGGANGSIRFDPEIKHGANAGLPNALALMESVTAKYPEIGHADMMQLASATAVELMGGPKIPMRYGRKDATGPDMCHPEGNLPAGAAPWPSGGDAPGHLRAIFHRMGLTDKDIVALSGAHSVGRAHVNRSGLCHKPETKYTAGPGCPMGVSNPGGASWTKDWFKFSNDYFTAVKAHDDPELLVLETDSCLFTDEGFKPFAEKYAADQDAFFADYAESHKKLSELGVKWDGEPVTL